MKIKNSVFAGISDLMSGLMMMFLFIAIVFMLDVQQSKIEIQAQKDAMAKIVETDVQTRQQLHQDLLKEFESDLEKWNADILADNTVRFNAPKVLFLPGESVLRPKFKAILDSFFIRYVNILQRYRDDIASIRIEGHTSSNWDNIDNRYLNDLDLHSPENLEAIVVDSKMFATRYFKNIDLSQKRASSTLKYCYLLLLINDDKNSLWLQDVFEANGLSFARRIFVDGVEDAEKSRRVEFKVVIKTKEKLDQILERSRSVK
jgi:outer membrane protein OmpA-like peptidoglycan-associated protein